jgi:rhodanese-related sulfurtransferase
MIGHRTHPIDRYTMVVDADTQVIDVRQPAELADGTLAGAVNIPLDRLAARIGELDPTRRTVVFCRSGGRSSQAAEFLAGAGFVDVINLAGGMLALPQGATR